MSNPLPNAEELYANLLMQLKKQIAMGAHFELAGLASGGAWIAKRLAQDLSLPHFGIINGSFHRDDYLEKGVKALNSAQGLSTNLPFNVDGAHIILIDDVLDSGRTVRAALNELFDYGRPAKVDLAVLVDRQRRQLPVDATFKGSKVNLLDAEILVLEKTENDLFFFDVEKINRQ